MEENRKITSEKMSKRYKFTIYNNIISDLTLYSNWEKKGFLIKIKKEGFDKWEKVERIDHIILDGEIVTKKN